MNFISKLIKFLIMVALASLLSQLQLYHFPQGGAVTLGAMVPLLLVSFLYGVKAGALAGFLFGLIQIYQDPFILHPFQIWFDYPLSFMTMGLAGFFPQRLILGTAVAFAGRFACHFISGVTFFASYAPEGISPIIYSLIANATYILPEFLICCGILKLLPTEKLFAAVEES